jgi:hypothetical protein
MEKLAAAFAGLALALSLAGCGKSAPEGPTPPGQRDPCAIKSIQKRDPPLNLFISPDSRKFAENKKDANGVYQVYVGDMANQASSVCISCAQAQGGPRADAQKMMVVWHPSSRWLFVGGEIPHVRPPWISAEQDLGLMQSGINLDMYVTRPEGGPWYRLTDLAGSGYVGPGMTADGHAYYAQIVNGNVLVYTFGKWLLKRADFVVDRAGVPSLANTVDLSPADTNWIEPGNVSPDGRYLILTLDTGLEPNKAAGMDQWLLELATGRLTDLNKTPKEWDEHGWFAPNSKKIVFMSSHPYPAYDATTALFGIFGLKTEFMLMDVDGSNLVQLTHFGQAGYPESTTETSVAATATFSADGSQLIAAQLLTGAHFPEQVTWIITLAGRCGGDGGF